MSNPAAKLSKTGAWNNTPREVSVYKLLSPCQEAVTRILMHIDYSKVTQSVVRTIPIDMIDHLSVRKVDAGEANSYSVNKLHGQVLRKSQMDTQVSARVWACRNRSRKTGIKNFISSLAFKVLPWSFLPNQLSSLRIVVKALFKEPSWRKRFDFTACWHNSFSCSIAHSFNMGCLLEALWNGCSTAPRFM